MGNRFIIDIELKHKSRLFLSLDLDENVVIYSEFRILFEILWRQFIL
jgi:hypothetical protein